MKKLPILTGVVAILMTGMFGAVFAWQADPNAPAVSDAGEASQSESSKVVAASDAEALSLLQEAKNRLFESSGIKAEIAQVISLGNQRFRSGGAYQSSSGGRYRLEYQVKLGDLEGRFLEVSDGQIVHTRRQVGQASASPAAATVPDVELTRRDIQKILREVRQHQDRPDAIRAAEIGLGGLPSVLASLERSMIFGPVRSQTSGSRQFLVLQGSLNPKQRAALLQGLGGFANQIGGYLPDQVQIWLAQDTLFPERFLYLKKTGADEKSMTPMASVEFVNLVLNEPISPQAFRYLPPQGVEEKDDTARFLEMINNVAPQAPSGESAPEDGF